MRKAVSVASIRRELAELTEKARAQLCTCGKNTDGRIVYYSFSKTCAEERAVDAEEAKPRSRCPAMHQDGDAEPIRIRIGLAFCRAVACECHKAAEHNGCPTCDPDYFARHKNGSPHTEQAPAGATIGPPRLAHEPTADPTPGEAAAAFPGLSRAQAAAYRNASAWAARQLTGRARDRVVEVERVDPMFLPPCACSHGAQLHNEYRGGGTGCAVVMDIGAVRRGPCQCATYQPREAP